MFNLFDIVAATNDCVAFMKKMANYQVYLDNYDIHVAVTDVLYKSKKITEVDLFITSVESVNDYEKDILKSVKRVNKDCELSIVLKLQSIYF